MHTSWFNKYKLDNRYEMLEVPPDTLKATVKKFRSPEWLGFNVTVPHKVAIFSLIDEVDEKAQLIGAVNTVINHGGKLTGTNTDGEGFIQSLLHAGFSLTDKVQALIIGAGGAARAVGFALAKSGIKRLDFTNRTQEKAEALSEVAKEFTASSALSLSQAEEGLADYQLVINATSVGMEPFPDHIPLSLRHVMPGTFCVDLIYKPLQTLWLKEADSKRCQTLNGLPMLVYQGALAFKHWFGNMPEVDGVETLLVEYLNGNKQE